MRFGCATNLNDSEIDTRLMPSRRVADHLTMSTYRRQKIMELFEAAEDLKVRLPLWRTGKL